MEVSIMKRIMQEEMRWELMKVSDMCTQENEDLCRRDTEMKYFDEDTWEELDREKVVAGQGDALERSRNMDVYDFEMREVAMNDEIGKFMKVKCVRSSKGALQRIMR